jgi:hypothetical protein
MELDILNKFKEFLSTAKHLTDKEVKKAVFDIKNFLQTGDFSKASSTFTTFLYIYSSDFTNDEEFGLELMANFPKNKNSNVLEVTAGHDLKVAKFLAKNRYTVSIIDPLIKIKYEKLKLYNIKPIKSHFLCDHYVGKGKGSPVNDYDFIEGIRTCGATEHIVRQGLEYDKPFSVLLCNCIHRSLNGKEFRCRDEWYDYLNSISSEAKIIENKGFHYITNLKKINTDFVKPVQDFDM